MLYGKMEKTTPHSVLGFTSERYPDILSGINLDDLPGAIRENSNEELTGK
jgi:hypothetical protein